MSLKLAWLIYGSLAQATGGYVYDRIIIERLRARSVHVEVISLIPNQPAALELAARQLYALRPDALIGDALCTPEIGPLFEAWDTRALRVLLVHHLTSWELEIDPADRAVLMKVEQRALAACDLMVTTSFATAARLSQTYSACRTEVIAPGADRLRRGTRLQHTSDIILLGVGSIIARKRWELLLEALEDLALGHVHLRLVGDHTRDPAYSRSIKARTASSSYLSAHVNWVGLVTSYQLAHEFANADALVLPSSLEGYGMVVTEALHAGLPVIASRHPAISEALANHAGAALRFEDAAALRLQLLRFANDQELRLALRSAATRLATALPTWGSAEARFYDLLHQRPSVLARTNTANCWSDEP